ncbi:nitroreductase family deazaflavin-dependent oxidoreductase [Pedococcus bigeumensis]|uniref:nitroreductase family deazaflavin-dependent oxidoreductase n=1 Tax=Pedococcus bigeumensis TaxID=433644 RepID=UPI0019D5A757|nr:nitroreductase family deazaflavin-dependent oxidoreductase [Pedococcus bigeumensis]
MPDARRPDRAAPRSQSLAPWLRASFGAPNALYANGFGWLLGRRFLRLSHTGRRSGRTFHVVLEVVRYDRTTGEATVISGFGETADWLRNLRAGGRVEVDFGRGPSPAAYRVLGLDEAEATYAAYERRNLLIAPLVRWTLTALLGWTYDGSRAARRRMVAELPLVALRLAAHRTARPPQSSGPPAT